MAPATFHYCLNQGCESICEKKSEIIWNAWKDVLYNALKVWKWGFVKSKKVWNHIKNLNSHNPAEFYSLTGYNNGSCYPGTGDIIATLLWNRARMPPKHTSMGPMAMSMRISFSLTSLSAFMARRMSSRSLMGRFSFLVMSSMNSRISSISVRYFSLQALPNATHHAFVSVVSDSFKRSEK